MSPIFFITYSLPGEDQDVRRYRPPHWTSLTSYLERGEQAGAWKLVCSGENGGPMLPDLSDEANLVATTEVVHICGNSAVINPIPFPSANGIKMISENTLADGLAAFPKLKLVTLEGLPSESLVRSLLQAGVPLVLVLDDKGVQAQIAIEIYQGLLRGENLLKVFMDTAGTSSVELSVTEIDPDDSLPVWMGRDAKQTLAKRGIWVRKDRRDAWQFKVTPEVAYKPPVPLTDTAPPRDNPLRASGRIRKPDATKPGAPQPPAKPKAERKRPLRKEPEKLDDRPPRHIRWGRWAVGGMALAATYILLAVAYPSLVPESVSKIFHRGGCPFPENDNFYHVLLLPVYESGSCEPANNNSMSLIYDRMESLRLKLGLEVKTVLQSSGACPPSLDQATNAGDFCRSDLVVWGEWNVSPDGREQLILNFFSHGVYGEAELMGEKTQSLTIDADELLTNSDVVSASVENIACWSLANMRQQNGDLEGAIAYLERIDASSPNISQEVRSKLIDAYVRTGRIEEALEPLNLEIQDHPDDPQTFMRRANLLAKTHFFQRAIEDYSQSLKLDPGFYDALIGRAVVYEDMDALGKALADYSRVLNQAPNLSPVYVTRGKVYARLGEYNKAISDYNTSIGITPNYADAYLERALAKLKTGNEAGAREDAQAALRLNPNLPGAKVFEGEISATQGEWEEAFGAYSKDIALSGDAEIYFRRAFFLRMLGRTNDALADLNEAIRILPGWDKGLIARSEILQSMGKYPEALNDLDEMLHYHPGSDRTHLLRGILLGRMGKNAEAEEELKAEVKKHPQSTLACETLVNFYLDHQEPDRALEVVSASIGLFPQEAGLHVIRGAIYARIGLTSEALANYAKASALNPGLAITHLRKGELYQHVGNLVQADRETAEALRLDPQLYEALLLRARLKMEDGKVDLALPDIAKAIEQRPGDAPAYALRARCIYLKGDVELALNELQKAQARKPEAYIYLIQRADWLGKTGRYEEAFQDLSKAIRLDARNVNPAIDKALLHIKLRQWDLATESLDLAERSYPNEPRLIAAKARLTFVKNPRDAVSALTELNKSLSAQPRSAEALTLRGQVYASLDKIAEALADFNKAVEIDRNYAPAYLERGNFGRKAAMYSQAENDFTKAIERDPLLAEAWYQRGFVRNLAGKMEEALQDVQYAAKLEPRNPMYLGLLSKLYARNHQEDNMYVLLEDALKNKFPPLDLADPAFNPYRESARFQQLVKSYRPN